MKAAKRLALRAYITYTLGEHSNEIKYSEIHFSHPTRQNIITDIP